jgi:glycosyltransferase involved in cell wall biosynthesis
MRFDDYLKGSIIDRRADAPESPLVSIILPTYVRADGMLPRAIESVLSQSFGDFELILVDDGSRDGTADLLDGYQRADSRVSVHRHRFNSGLPALRVDQAALSARGRMIAYQFDDDIWTPDSLALRVKALQRCDSPAAVYGIAEFEVRKSDGPPAHGRSDQPFNYGKLVGGNYIGNNSVLHSIELFEMAGLYDPHVLIRRLSDYDLWLRFGAVADFVFIDEVISKVNANQPNSPGTAIPGDYTIARKYLATDRNDALKPAAIRNYEVVGTEMLRGIFSQPEIDQIRRRTIIPFLTTHNDYMASEDLLPEMISRRNRKTLLVTKTDFSTSVDVTIRNITGLKNAPFRDFFVAERDLGEVDWRNADILVLYRTVMETTTDRVRALKDQMPIAYFMDDNMLRFGEMGPEHEFLGPGTPYGNAIRAQIREAHAGIGFSDQIIADMRALNPHAMRLDVTIPLRFLEPRAYHRGPRLKLALLSSPVRREIMRALWPALVDFARTAPDEIEFHFWGMDPAEFGKLPCPVFWQPFTHSYDLYRSRLMKVDFDIMLVPLDDALLVSQSKSPVKLFESICCGAICIFTDTPPYRHLPDEICLKTRNTIAAWKSALEQARDLGPQGRAAMLERARRYTREHHGTERQLASFTGSFDAVQLHRRLGDRSIVYVFHEAILGGATLHLLRHARMAKGLGFRVVGVIEESSANDPWGFSDRWREISGGAPLVIGHWRSGYVRGADQHRTPDSLDEAQAQSLAEILAPHRVGLVHATTWNPVAALLGKALEVPVALSLHQFYPTEDGAALGIADAIHCSSLRYARDWEQATQAPVRRIVCPVEKVFFDAFASNLPWHRERGGPLRLLMSGTIQKRKNQLEAIRAVDLLVRQGHDVTLDLIGYDNLLHQYVESCRQEIATLGLQDRVTLHGFTDRPEKFYRGHGHILLMASTGESMPQTVLQAMAAGLLVVTTEVGGVGELIRHRYSGIVADGSDAAALAQAIGFAASLSEDRMEEILRRARRSIELIGREDYVRAELIDLYNQAFENSVFGEKLGNGRSPVSMAVVNKTTEIQRLQHRVRQLETSLSFRLTAPIRLMARKLRPVAWLANRIHGRR